MSEAPRPQPDDGNPGPNAAERARERAQALRRAAPQAEAGSAWDERMARARKVFPSVPPYTPIGMSDGRCWVLSNVGDLVGYAARDLSRNGISMLAGAEQAWLIETYPRKKRKANDNPDSFAPEQAADDIIAACRIMGSWSPVNHVRGRGAWLGADGDLILHLGDKLAVGTRLVECGVRGGYVYPVAERLPRPASEGQPGGPHGPGAALLKRLESFSFRRGGVDRRLLLGWICLAFVGGALETRPHVFLTGERGVGKSTFLLLLRLLFGDGAALIAASDASPAGLWQAIRHDALPVTLDELESEADNSKADAIIRLLRQASTGGMVLRGGQDHRATTFTVRSPFLCASIIMPAMRAQDRSRLCQIDMQAMAHTGPFSILGVSELGRALFRRMVDAWPRLQADSLPLYRATLMAHGWDDRGASVYGTLLACADVALHDEPAREECEDFCAALAETRAAHRADESPSWRRCIDHLQSFTIDPWRRGERTNVGALIERAAGYGEAHPEAPDDDGRDPSLRSEAEAQRAAEWPDSKQAHGALRGYGLRIEYGERDSGAHATRFLAVANTHPELSIIYRGTDWASEPGRPGAWRQALERTPGARTKRSVTRFRGHACRAVLVPLDAVLAGVVGMETLPEGVTDEDRATWRPDEAAPEQDNGPDNEG